MVSAMDEAVGRIVRTIKSNNMLEETLFVFLSDNGANTLELEGGNNWPLRRGKNSLWEGGTLVPSFVLETFFQSLFEDPFQADYFTSLTGFAHC